MSRLRLLPFGTFDPEYNMALDAVLLERVGSAASPPTFRFYEWNRPTLSLGRGQAPQSLGLARARRGAAFAVVQRPTGGAVAVHGRDLSYSLAAPRPCDFLPRSPKACYRAVHEALAEALCSLGCEATCVEDVRGGGYREKIYCGLTLSAYDIVSGGRKVVGSAQRLSSRSLLQHGFILIDEDFDWVIELLGQKGQAVARACATLSELAGRSVDLATLRARILGALETGLGVVFESSPLEPEERRAVEQWLIERRNDARP